MIFLLQKLSVCFPFAYGIEFKHLNVVFGVFPYSGQTPLAGHISDMGCSQSGVLTNSQISPVWLTSTIGSFLQSESHLPAQLPETPAFPPAISEPLLGCHVQVYLGAVAGLVPEPQNKQISQWCESDKIFGLPVHRKVMFILNCSIHAQ